MSRLVIEPSTGPPNVATRLSDRSLAPDLARGTMLLLIALAHAHMYLYGHPKGFRGYQLNGGPIDQVVAGLQVLFVDGRALPMFAALFGYGLVQLANRRIAAGAEWPDVRRLLRRRSLWLIAFGFAHALLLFFGDILVTYGLLSLILVGMVRARDRVLLWVAGLWILVFAALAMLPAWAIITEGSPPLPTSVESPIEAVGQRLAVWAGLGPMLALDIVTPFLLGIWAARRRLLDEPGRHRALLTRVAVAGIVITILGGAPLALMDSQIWTDWTTGTAVPVYALHSVTGIAGGLAYAALAGLIAHRVADAPGRVATALAACGQRSLTCYLLQSVGFVALFAPFTLGLGGRLGDAGAAAVAIGTWLTTVLLAELMRRAGWRGPAEGLLRRLTYAARRPATR
ncbi:DUF418 domain-containing protein [Plantactinospora soyae]|uniref:Membrane protein YeiB n=1 Tax=Plantactinospora soyae TaxID=1544732 RepID=A0A927M7B2_9ACTN|nr:DUF418 domain-containing protein [Plantactinospora soyae]MBE1486698.1 putative membrane protein YeiB [Plantactinospora soyae]